MLIRITVIAIQTVITFMLIGIMSIAIIMIMLTVMTFFAIGIVMMANSLTMRTLIMLIG